MNNSITHIPIYYEDVVLENVLTLPAFARFYEAERHHIPWHVYWTLDHTLPQGGFQCDHWRPEPGDEQPEYCLVHLPHIPAFPNEAFGIAHELIHPLLEAEGYPGIKGIGRSTLLATILGSLLTDLVINERLGVYGFDTGADIEAQFAHAARDLGQQPAPTDPIIYAQWLFSITGVVLEGYVANQQQASKQFQQWFTGRYPKLGRDVRKLVTTIRTSGYATPQQQTWLLRRIIYQYGLKRWDIAVFPTKNIIAGIDG